MFLRALPVSTAFANLLHTAVGPSVHLHYKGSASCRGCCDCTEETLYCSLGTITEHHAVLCATPHAYPVPAARAQRVAAPHGGSKMGNAMKMLRAVKTKANGSGRTYTSKYRGVHQTFPTKRWEAQFRRNGKPTSLGELRIEGTIFHAGRQRLSSLASLCLSLARTALDNTTALLSSYFPSERVRVRAGCFDHEEEAARAYDKMMLWCELHNAAGVKSGITNFDPLEYEKEFPWLQSVTQVGPRRNTMLLLKAGGDSGLWAGPLCQTLSDTASACTYAIMSDFLTWLPRILVVGPQDELIESLRSEGRRQAAHRMLRQKREGATDAGTDDYDDVKPDPPPAMQQQQLPSQPQSPVMLLQPELAAAMAQLHAAQQQQQQQQEAGLLVVGTGALGPGAASIGGMVGGGVVQGGGEVVGAAEEAGQEGLGGAAAAGAVAEQGAGGEDAMES